MNRWCLIIITNWILTSQRPPHIHVLFSKCSSDELCCNLSVALKSPRSSVHGAGFQIFVRDSKTQGALEPPWHSSQDPSKRMKTCPTKPDCISHHITSPIFDLFHPYHHGPDLHVLVLLDLVPSIDQIRGIGEPYLAAHRRSEMNRRTSFRLPIAETHLP